MTSLLDAVIGTEPVAPPRSGPARAALRHRRPDLRGGRAVGGRHRLRRASSCACSARARRSASCRSDRRRPRRSDEWFSPRGRAALVPAQWRRRDDAEAVFLNQRGGRLSRQAAWLVVKKYGDRAGHPRAPLAARAAPLVRHAPARPRRRPARSCRRCSATRRSRPRRSTPRSARSGSGTSTARPTPAPPSNRRTREQCAKSSRRMVMIMGRPRSSGISVGTAGSVGRCRLWRRCIGSFSVAGS